MSPLIWRLSSKNKHIKKHNPMSVQVNCPGAWWPWSYHCDDATVLCTVAKRSFATTTHDFGVRDVQNISAKQFVLKIYAIARMNFSASMEFPLLSVPNGPQILVALNYALNCGGTSCVGPRGSCSEPVHDEFPGAGRRSIDTRLHRAVFRLL